MAHYTYDALGRVIRTQTLATANTTPSRNAALAITDFYYDGVRVVQEVGWGGGGTGSVHGGGAGVPTRTARNKAGSLDTTLPGLPRRSNEMSGGGTSWGSCAPPSGENAGGWDWADRRLQREYIWNADASAYVDECVAQLAYTAAHDPASGTSPGDPGYKGSDTTATILYTLHDHNANVIGLADSRGELVAQYSYTPYGELLANGGAEYFTPDSFSGKHRSSHRGQGQRPGPPRPPQSALRSALGRRDGHLNCTLRAKLRAQYRCVYHSRNRTVRMTSRARGGFIEDRSEWAR